MRWRLGLLALATALLLAIVWAPLHVTVEVELPPATGDGRAPTPPKVEPAKASSTLPGGALGAQLIFTAAVLGGAYVIGRRMLRRRRSQLLSEFD